MTRLRCSVGYSCSEQFKDSNPVLGASSKQPSSFPSSILYAIMTNEGIGEQIMEIQNKNMKNVHAPVFNPTNAANLEVLESADIGTLLTQIVAYDEDKGYNLSLTSFKRIDIDKFADFLSSIGAESMAMISKLYLGIFSRSSSVFVYHIPVLACDQGSPSLSSTATVTLNIMDENDNIPKFIPESYDLKVREDLPVGSVITTVKAVDPDSGFEEIFKDGWF
jgi:hypothetical protein